MNGLPRRNGMEMRQAVFGCVVAVGLFAAGELSLFAGPAGAVADPPIPKLSKKASGPFVEDLDINLAPGKAKDVFLRLKSTYQNEGQFEFDGPVVIDDYTLKYFKLSGKNITTKLDEVDEWFEFALPPHGAKVFRIRVKLPDGGDPGGICAMFRTRVDYDPSPLPHNSSQLIVNENPLVCFT
jgi:hypothetical protein